MLLESTPVEGKWGNRSGQREKVGCDAVWTSASAECSEAGMELERYPLLSVGAGCL